VSVRTLYPNAPKRARLRGRRGNHIIDPRRAAPRANDWRSRFRRVGCEFQVDLARIPFMLMLRVLFLVLSMACAMHAWRVRRSIVSSAAALSTTCS